MTNSILGKKGFKKVSKRTIQNDIKIFENLGLIKSHLNPLGKNNGSFTYYTINKALEKLAKKIKTIEESQKYKISYQITSHVLRKNKSKYYKLQKFIMKFKRLYGRTV